MTGQAANGRWQRCGGCGRERRLARGGAVMCERNRWDAAVGEMVPCEGSGQQPAPLAAQAGTDDHARPGEEFRLVRGGGVMAFRKIAYLIPSCDGCGLAWSFTVTGDRPVEWPPQDLLKPWARTGGTVPRPVCMPTVSPMDDNQAPDLDTVSTARRIHHNIG